MRGLPIAMSGRLVCAAIVGSLLALAAGARAQSAAAELPPVADLAMLGAVEVVDHDAGNGIATCPDAAGLQARIAALRDRAGATSTRALRIHLATAEHGREARMQVAQANGVRTLDLASLSCEQALEAISVAAVMLLEDSVREQPLPPAAEATAPVTAPPPAAPPPAPPPQPKAPSAPPPVPAPEKPLPDPGYWLTAVGGGTWGVVRDFGFNAALGTEITVGAGSFGLRAGLTLPLDQSLGGSLDLHSELLALEPSACVRGQPILGDIRFRGCAVMTLGLLTLSSTSPAGQNEVQLLYFAGGIGVGFDGPLTERRLGLNFTLELLLPTQRDEFERADTGERIFRSPIVALRALLGARFRFL